MPELDEPAASPAVVARLERSRVPHIVLLGASIFDNAASVGSGPDVVAQLRGDLPAGWTASLGGGARGRDRGARFS